MEEDGAPDESTSHVDTKEFTVQEIADHHVDAVCVRDEVHEWDDGATSSSLNNVAEDDAGEKQADGDGDTEEKMVRPHYRVESEWGGSDKPFFLDVSYQINGEQYKNDAEQKNEGEDEEKQDDGEEFVRTCFRIEAKLKKGELSVCLSSNSQMNRIRVCLHCAELPGCIIFSMMKPDLRHLMCIEL